MNLELIAQEFSKGNRNPRCYVSDTHENPLDDPRCCLVYIDDVFLADEKVSDTDGFCWKYAILAP